MKKTLFIIMIFGLFPIMLMSQSRHLVKAAEKSFDDAESFYKKEKFPQAAANYEIVLNTIPINSDSRKNIIMRLDANSSLIDIYFNKHINMSLACEKLSVFIEDVNYIKNVDILKGKHLYKYLQLEKEYKDYQIKCESYKSIETEKSDFEKKFEKEFED